MMNNIIVEDKGVGTGACCDTPAIILFYLKNIQNPFQSLFEKKKKKKKSMLFMCRVRLGISSNLAKGLASISL